MTKEELLVKASEILSNDEVAKRYLSANSPEEMRSILAENGLEITLEELNDISVMSYELLNDKGELKTEDLDSVSGGVPAGFILIGGTLVVLGGVCVCRRAYLKLKKR